MTAEEVAHARRAAAALRHLTVPPLSDELKDAAYRQLIDVCDSHERLRARVAALRGIAGLGRALLNASDDIWNGHASGLLEMEGGRAEMDARAERRRVAEAEFRAALDALQEDDRG